jgi:hypothetical protein
LFLKVNLNCIYTNVVGKVAAGQFNLRTMTNGKYIDYYDFDSDRVNELLKSTNVKDKLDGLLTTVLGSGDYETSDKLIFQFTNSDEVDLRRNAILCIGHLVRIYKKIDLEKYSPILEDILSNQDELLVDNAENALNDIWIFFARDKVKEAVNADCIRRYLNVLAISESAESNETYDKGINALEELARTESNRSVKRVQKTSVDYLNNLRNAASSPQQNVQSMNVASHNLGQSRQEINDSRATSNPPDSSDRQSPKDVHQDL